MTKYILSFVIIGFFASCAPFPDLDHTIDPAARDAGYPALVPLGPILNAANASQTTIDATDINGRIAALNARANRLRGAVIDSATLARIRRGVTLQ